MKRVAIIIACLTTLFVLSSACSMAAQYQVVDIGICDFFVHFNPKINNFGQVAGYLVNPSGNDQPIVWENGVSTFIPTYGGSYGYTSDINNAGHVVGQSYGSDGYLHAFIWKDGHLSSSDTFGSGDSFLSVINDLGDVAYTANGPTGQRHLFIRENSEIRDLGAPASSTDIAAFGINNSGMIAGWYWNNRGGHSFVYQNGSMDDIGDLGGGQAVAHGVNNLGQITGYSRTGVEGDYLLHAFLWQNGVMADLGVFDQLDTYALSINNKSQIVGFAGSSFIPELGLLRVDNQFVNLNTLISPESGWTITAATDINDLGQIVGYGTLNGKPHMVLLNPVPEPSSLLALACGLGSISGMMWRRMR